MRRSSGSVDIAVILKILQANKFRAAAMLLFYILQNNYMNKSRIFVEGLLAHILSCVIKRYEVGMISNVNIHTKFRENLFADSVI
jgi:hypothetical protein